MKITRHLAPDMRQALKAVKEQLGPDAVILSSRRTAAGVEITAAMDFDTEELRAAEGLAKAANAQPPASFNVPTAHAAPEIMPVNPQTAAAARAKIAAQVNARTTAQAEHDGAQPHNTFARSASTPEHNGAQPHSTFARSASTPEHNGAQPHSTFARSASTPEQNGAQPHNTFARSASTPEHNGAQAHSTFARGPSNPEHNAAQPHSTFARSASTPEHNGAQPHNTFARSASSPATPAHNNAPRLAAVATPAQRPLSQSAALLIGATSTTARSQPIGQVMQALAKQTPGQPRATQPLDYSLEAQVAKAANLAEHAIAAAEFAPQAFLSHAPRDARAPQNIVNHAPRYEAAPQDFADDSYEAHAGIPTAQAADLIASDAPVSAADLMGNELKTLRRMLETQMAQLAWNDLSRRAPIHTEMLRELTEIGLGPELAAQVVSQLPGHTDLTQARRLSIATLSQQVLVTGDRWLEDGGRVALVGPTGVGKTTTLAKLAVRWVLRHGPRDLAIVAGDSLRIGAHEQLNALGQLLGARVYPLQNLDDLPALLTKLASSRFVLIDTPGSSQRDAQLASRLEALTSVGPDLETALVLGASTQAGTNAEVVQRFAAVNPASCVLTKVDEASSLGGLLSVLVRARLPVSYMSEGQRVPEDLRPARSLELVSSAVQLAQTAGAAADEDLLRRRFGEMAHAIA
jgi:flagellar biosynthesis protein FlhF